MARVRSVVEFQLTTGVYYPPYLRKSLSKRRACCRESDGKTYDRADGPLAAGGKRPLDRVQWAYPKAKRVSYIATDGEGPSGWTNPADVNEDISVSIASLIVIDRLRPRLAGSPTFYVSHFLHISSRMFFYSHLFRTWLRLCRCQCRGFAYHDQTSRKTRATGPRTNVRSQ